MQYRRAIGINVVLYLATLVITVAILALRGDPLQFSTPPNTHQITWAMMIGTILTTAGAWWYFRTQPGSARAGLWFGVIAILVGLAMDMVVSVGIWMSGKNPFDFLTASYSLPFFGVMLGSVLVLTTVVGARKR